MKPIAIILLALFIHLDATAADYAVLDSLDAYISKAAIYDAQKRNAIQKLQGELRKAHGNEQLFHAYSRMYEAYSSFQYDTAATYANRMLIVAKKLDNPDYVVKAKLARVFTLLSAGLYKEAADQIADIDVEKAGKEARLNYFLMRWKFLASIVDYVHAEPYQSNYIRQAAAMTDSLRHYLPKEHPTMLYIERMMASLVHHDVDASYRYFQKALNSPSVTLHERAIIISSLGWVYRNIGDNNKALECIVKAAIYDIQSATKETTAVREAGNLLYMRGDIDRAFAYVRKALDDANFYGARQRKIEIGNILPIIQQERYQAMAYQRNIIIAATIAVLLLLIAVLASLFFIRRQMKTLQAARHTIEEHNKQLKLTNAQLVEANKIKEVYIGRSFYVNAEYIAKVEKLYRTVDRMIKAGQHENLRQSLKESTLIKERKTMYADFDETFLTLFPDFINRYNMLFDEANRVVPEQKMTLTTEMRIFALIRVGVNDSERIAQFLNYSVNTINTYKTRVKNKSLVSNDLFEQKIMLI